MKITKSIFVIGLVLSLFSCHQSNKETTQNNGIATEAAIADSATIGLTTSGAADVYSADTVHKFIRTADLKFKVLDVAASTFKIEDAVKHHGGFITYTYMAGKIDKSSVNAISEDCSIVSTHYTVTNSITLRVPDTMLDTTLKEIAANVDFLDVRVIKAEDVSLQILANKIAQLQGTNHETRLVNAIDKKGTKLNDVINAEETLLNNQQNTSNFRISNLALTNQIKFSTVTLSIYQREVVRNEIIANEKDIKPFKMAFGRRIIAAMQSGWEMFESLVIFITNLWALLLLFFIGYVLFKKYGPNFLKN